MNESKKISLAIPLYNEEEVFPELFSRVSKVLDSLDGGPHEIVFVDDGSRDGTQKLLEEACEKDDRVTAIVLSRNFGHQAAYTAALDHVTGDVVIVMDGDLQDRPEEIPRFLEKHAQGFDVVFAKRTGRKEAWPLRLCYYVFYRMISLLSNISLPLDSGDFALLSADVVKALRKTPERHRYLRGLRAWVGFRQTGIDVERGARAAGQSKYSIMKLLALAFDGLFSFTTVPLRAAAVIGAFGVAAASAFALYSVYAKIVLGQPTQGFTALILAIVFSLGLQLLFLGIIGEYIGRIYEEVKSRPHYIVGKMLKKKN